MYAVDLKLFTVKKVKFLYELLQILEMGNYKMYIWDTNLWVLNDYKTLAKISIYLVLLTLWEWALLLSSIVQIKIELEKIVTCLLSFICCFVVDLGLKLRSLPQVQYFFSHASIQNSRNWFLCKSVCTIKYYNCKIVYNL